MSRAPRASCLLLSLALVASACESKPERAAQTLPERGATHQPVTSESSKPLPKVAVLGDSLAAGLGLAEDEAFPAQLAARFAERGVPFALANAGLSGDTSAGGLRRVDWLLAQHPTVVVVELGANDGLRGRPLPELEQNLLAILRKITDAGACPVLLGMVLPPSLGQDYTEAFAAVYARIAAQTNVIWVPYFMKGVAGVPALNLEDGLHPTTQGQRLLADNVAPALSRALEGCGRGTSAP